MSKLFLTFIAVIVAFQLFAQQSADSAYQRSINKRNAKREKMNNLLKMEEEGDLIFNKHNIFGIRLATDGYGINFEKGYFKTPYRTLLFSAELNEKHDPKEHHISVSDQQGDVSSLVPYKLYNLYEFKLAVGQEHLIGGKGNKNGVAVHGLYSGGFTVGMLKPYLYNVRNIQTGATGQMRYDQILNQDSTNASLPTGTAGFFAGWGQLKIKPAVNAKQALRFDYGRLNQTVTAIEAGLTEEYFFGKIPFMYLVQQHSFFFSAYVQIMFGSRK